MAVVKYQQQAVEVKEDESLLSALENAGVSIPNSCRAGLCQSCLVVVKNGQIPPASQQGLNPHQIKQNLLMSCQCLPQSDIEVALPEDDFRSSAQLISKQIMNDQVIKARFKASMPWHAGQYTTLWKNTIEGRTFSIASTPDEGEIELHIRRRADGVISQWLENELRIGDSCLLSDAKGHCFYNAEDTDQPLVLAATGTGLAPVYGVLKQALAAGHCGPITLYAAAGEPSQLYLVDELKTLSQNHDNFDYYPVVKRDAASLPGALQGDLVQLVSQRHKSLRGHQVYLCGAPEMVKKLKKLCFLQEASMKDILADAFECAATPCN